MGEEDRERGLSWVEVHPRRSTRLGALVVAVAMGALLVTRWIVCDGECEVGITDIMLVALILGPLLFVLWPEGLFRIAGRVSQVGIGDLTIALAVEARGVVVRVPDANDDVEVKARRTTASSGGDLRVVQEQLVKHLRFLRDAVLDLDRSLEPLEVARVLRRRQLLRDEEYDVTHHLLEEAPDELFNLTKAERDAYLDDVWKWASRLHAECFERFVQLTLEEDGWVIYEFKQGTRHRREMLARSEAGNWWLLTARPADPPASAVEATAKRLGGYLDPENRKAKARTAFQRASGSDLDGSRTVIVAPDHLCKRAPGVKQIEDVANDFAEKPQYRGVQLLRLRQLMAKDRRGT